MTALPLAGLGTEDIEVAGESYRPESFARIFATAGRPLGGVLMRTAVLVADPKNPYDRFAVAVYVDGAHVGFVPAYLAPSVQPVVLANTRARRQTTVLARVWACCEAGDWSARVTLSFSGQSEQEWSYVDFGPWPGNRSPDGSERLTQTGRINRLRHAEAVGRVRGRDFDSLRPQVAQAKAAGDTDTALRLVMDCVEAAERRAKVEGCRPATWPTEQAAILLRKQKDYIGEIVLLDRFFAADPSHQGTKGLRERLAKARTLAGQPGHVPAPPSRAEQCGFSAPARLDLAPTSPTVVVSLPAAAEVSYEKEHRDAIAAAFAEARIPLGNALETTAVLREIPRPGAQFTPVAVYVGGRLIGLVGALYADAVRALLREPHFAGMAVAVRCRIYARETPSWTARATLGPYEAVVASLDDTQSAAEGRANEMIMAELREERIAAGGAEARAQTERLVHGRDFVEWVERIRQLRRDRNDDEALVLLMECIEAAERDAKANGWQPPSWYTEQAAIILRKQGNLAGEVALLERFLAACPADRPQVDISERLIKARAKLSRAKG